MESAPSILLMDHGELEIVRDVLSELGLDFEHRRGGRGLRNPIRPLHLLVSSAKCTLRIPKLEVLDPDAWQPICVCAHSQDFLPLRGRLRKLGVHYLIDSELDRKVMRLFFLQLLHRGFERRRSRRLPLQAELSYQIGAVSGIGRIEEISRGGCRLVVNEEAVVGAPAILKLPPALARGEELKLRGRVSHCSSEAQRSGAEGYSLIVVFQSLAPEARAQVEKILAGLELATRITPLEPLPERPAVAIPQPPSGEPASPKGAPAERYRDGFPEFSAEEPPDPDRRSHARRLYARRLTALHADASDVLLGCDLSMTGIRIEPNRNLVVGTHVEIAVYPGEREEPVVLGAEVLREDMDGFGLRFESLSPEQTRQLERMLESLPPLESLAGDAPQGKRLVVSKLVRSEG